jgi:hypothetical protein
MEQESSGLEQEDIEDDLKNQDVNKKMSIITRFFETRLGIPPRLATP